MQISRPYLTIDDWEASIGEQIRSERVSRNLDQARLASLADISIGALSNLERGKGSSLKTLITVLRALDRTDWLESLAPPVSISPIQLLRAKRRFQPDRTRMRVRNSKRTPKT